MPIERVRVGPGRGDVLRVARSRSGAAVSLGGDRPASFRIEVRGTPRLETSWLDRDACWSMLPRVRFGVRSLDVFVELVAHGRRGRRLRGRDEAAELAWDRALVEALDRVSAHLVRACGARSREEALRFGVHARFWLYGRFLNDASGRLRQAAHACPGVLLFARGVWDDSQSWQAERLLDAIIAGERLDDAIDAALAVWLQTGRSRESDGAWGWFGGLDPLAAAGVLRRQRWLIRHASAAVSAKLLWLPPPVAFDPGDVPRGVRANAAWFRRMKRKAFYPLDPESEALSAAMSRYVSRHGAELQRRFGHPRTWVRELWGVVRRERWHLGRHTRLERVIGAVDRQRTLGLPLPGFPAATASPAAPRPADVEYPAQPVGPIEAGGLRFEPIMRLFQLYDEAIEMHHCVATYDGPIRLGERAILSVRPVAGGLEDRATLELVRAPGGWRIGQFKGFRNRAPSDAAHAALWSWVAEARSALEAQGACLLDAAPPPSPFDLDDLNDPQAVLADALDLFGDCDIPF